jgi:hypothetical protein
MKSFRVVLVFIIILASLAACKKKEEPLFYESGRAEAPVKEPSKEVLAVSGHLPLMRKSYTGGCQYIMLKKLFSPSLNSPLLMTSSEICSQSPSTGARRVLAPDLLSTRMAT